MGKKVLEAHGEVDEIKFSMPNKHHFLVDLSPFGLDNPTRSSSPRTAPTA
ncbi:uricase [Arthrobacter sp. Hiyo4]|nr:uricase [Arthrobacter sp. Hiyo4]